MFPNDLGLFYTESGNLKVRNPDPVGKSIGTWLSCFDFVCRVWLRGFASRVLRGTPPL